MPEPTWLVEQFEASRAHLRGVAYRMLGSLSEADDSVQETWIRLSRADTGSVENLGGWLTTVVARVCLDILRSRRSRREESLDGRATERIVGDPASVNPEQEAMLADSVGLALMAVLETLAPVERVAFVLHDMFALPFEEIAPIVGRSPAAARQLASRARCRVQGGPAVRNADLTRQRKVVDAFLSAVRARDFDGLLAVLDPEVVIHADQAAVPASASREVRGAQNAASEAITYSRGANFARLALVNGAVGVVVAPQGRLVRVLRFTFKR